MATFYAGGQSALSGQNKRLSGNQAGRPMCEAVLSYTFDGTEVEGDVINIIQLPKGARVLERLSFVKTSGTLAAATELDVGDDDGAAGDPNRYGTLLDVNAAGSVALDETPDYTLTEQSWVNATLTTFTTPAATGESLTFYLHYSLPAH